MNARIRPFALSLTALGIAALGATPAAADAQPPRQTGKAQVSVFHGVPGLTVDVYAGNQKLLPRFAPGTLTDPMPLASGTYNIRIFEAGADPAGTPAIEKRITVPAGANATVVAHLSEQGTPVLDAYVNDTSAVPAGKARLTVRHVAAAPAVDVRAGGASLFKNLVNPKETKAEVDPGSVNADVALAGTDTVVIGPADLNLPEGSNTVVYAWGSAQDKNLALKVQNVAGLESAPNGVSGGEGDLLSRNGGVPAWVLALSAAAALGAVYSTRRLVKAGR
jgi:hypothetical protein